jgi:diacylglycerol kinase (ATP)
MKIGVVLNPAAGGGRMRLEWPFFEAALKERFGDFELRATAGPGQAPKLAGELAEAGCDIVMAGGGDGTVSEVADGLLKHRANGGREAALAVASVGTGADFATAMRIPRRADRCVAAIADNPPRRIDAGRISFVTDTGEARLRHFISIASLGVSGEIDRVINAASAKKRGRMSGKALFFWFTIREFLRYRFQDVRIEVDGGAPVDTTITLVAIANNRSFGGGMMIAPMAAMHDGLLEVVVVKGTSRWRLVRDLRLVYTGDHIGLDSCIFMRGKKVTVTPLGDASINSAVLDIDGESPGRIPATFEVLPLALEVRGASPPP